MRLPRKMAFFATSVIVLTFLFSPAHGSQKSPNSRYQSALERLRLKRQGILENERRKYLVVGDIKVHLQSAQYFNERIWTFRYSKADLDPNRNRNRNAQIWTDAKVAQRSFIPKLAIDCQNMSYSVLKTGREWGDWYVPSSDSDEEQILVRLCDLKESN